MVNKAEKKSFESFIALVWLFSFVLFSIGVNLAFITNFRDLHGKVGLLHRPTTAGIEWKIDSFVKSLFNPIEAKAQPAVVCVRGCLSEEAYIASRAAEKAEITLLRSILTAFVRSVLTFIQNFVLSIVRQLSNAQDQFNFLKSIGQYAEQAVLLASKQAYNCSENTISTWAYGLFGESPPDDLSQDSCRYGLAITSQPTETEVVAAAQDYFDTCSALSLSSVLPSGCSQSEINTVEEQTEEIIREKIQKQCQDQYTAPMFREVTGGVYTCGGLITEKLNETQRLSEQRKSEVIQEASQTFDNYKNTIGSSAAFITADQTNINTPTTGNFPDIDASGDTPSPVFFPANLDIFDSSSETFRNLKIGFAKDPEALQFSHEYATAAINSKPQPSGESDNLATAIQDSFKGLLDQLLQKLQDMLFSFLNDLIAKLDLATGGSGVFSSLLSDITGTVKNYAQTQVSSLYSNISLQRQNLVNDLSQDRPVLGSNIPTLQNEAISNIAVIP